MKEVAKQYFLSCPNKFSRKSEDESENLRVARRKGEHSHGAEEAAVECDTRLTGYSCSEAVVKSAIDKGYVTEEALSIATSFSGGMGVRCLCGAVAGAQIVIGSMFGKKENERDGMKARALAKEFSLKFAEKFKVNCCKVLSSGYDFASAERKQHCSSMVEFSAGLVESILKENIESIK